MTKTLSEKQVRIVRILYSKYNYTFKQLAELTNCSTATIYYVIHRKGAYTDGYS